MRRVFFYISPLLVVGAIAGIAGLLLPAIASEKTSSPTTVSDAPRSDLGAPAEPLQWVAKVVCGTVPWNQYEWEAGPLVAGDYKTAVNVHNPGPSTVTVEKKIAVAYEDQVVGPIEVLPSYPLGSDFAFEVNCDEILPVGAPGEGGLGYFSCVDNSDNDGDTAVDLADSECQPALPWVKGFVVLKTLGGEPLDVSAVYTSEYLNTAIASEGLGKGLDIEPVPAQPWLDAPDPTAPDNQYAAKYVCGVWPGPDPVIDADYATAINVHNPNDFAVNARKKFVVAESEAYPGFGVITSFEPFTLGPDEAFEIDCEEIMFKTGKLGEANPPGFNTCFWGLDEDGDTLFDRADPDCHRKGFVVIESTNAELDVVPVYTVWRESVNPYNGQGLDIEVLRITKRGLPVPAPTDTPTATETPVPTDTPTATDTPVPTDTPTATDTPVPTDTPTVTPTPKPDLTELFSPCEFTFNFDGVNTNVHVGCTLIAAPPTNIHDWEVIYADQTPPMAGPALQPWDCSELAPATDWVPDNSLVGTRVKCEDPTHANNWWLVGECRDIHFTLPGAQGPWSTLILHATDQDQNNLGTFIATSGSPPC